MLKYEHSVYRGKIVDDVCFCYNKTSKTDLKQEEEQELSTL